MKQLTQAEIKDVLMGEIPTDYGSIHIIDILEVAEDLKKQSLLNGQDCLVLKKLINYHTFHNVYDYEISKALEFDEFTQLCDKGKNPYELTKKVMNYV